MDPKHEFFGPYLELRAEFDRLRAQGFGGRALEEIGKRMDCAFLTGLQNLGAAHRQPDGSKGVVLLLDTFEVVQEGRIGRWVLEDLLGQTEDICTGGENPPPIVAARDIAVVIAGRPRLDPAKTPASIRFCSPGNFSPDEIEHYLKQVLGRYQDVSLAADPVGQLTSWIADKTGGHPVLVALALDLANLYIATHGTPELTGGGLLHVLREIEGRGNLSTGLIEQIVDLLGQAPEQQWAVLFMAHLRRRFTRRLCAALMNRPPGDMGLEAAFTAFEHLYTYIYLSSGTWSLMGVELTEPIITAQSLAFNMTNEGGVYGTFRFLKNIMGLWLVQECRREWARAGERFSYDDLTRLAADSPAFGPLIVPGDRRFLPPGDMPARIQAFCQETGQRVPESRGAIIRCVLESLALEYRWVADRLSEIVGHPLPTIHIFGGGSQNRLLNQFTADATGRTVVAGPVEATAIGNALVQAIALGYIADLTEGRALVRHSFPVTTCEPRDTAAWDKAYDRYLRLRSPGTEPGG